MSGALLFFWLEVAELLRRWLWVFFRVEWEYVQRLNDRDWDRLPPQRSDAEEGLSGYRDHGENMEMEAMNSSVVFDAGKSPNENVLS